MAPWQGPRHQSWASNTVLMTIVLVTLIIATVVTDYFGEPPTYLTGLLGTAAGIWVAALGSDKNKREADVARTADTAQETAERAEAKADTLGRVTAQDHPDVVERITPPFDPHIGEGGDTT